VAEWEKRFDAAKSEGTVLVLFIPSVDRFGKPVDQEYWVTESLTTLGTLFGGATAFPQGRGVWRDDERGGHLVHDAPVIIQSYTSIDAIDRQAPKLREFLVRMGKKASQGAVGFVIDRTYLEIRFALEDK
jgi:hypothetical protein